MSVKISRQAYAEMFGPTVGDRLRLADTELWRKSEECQAFVRAATALSTPSPPCPDGSPTSWSKAGATS